MLRCGNTAGFNKAGVRGINHSHIIKSIYNPSQSSMYATSQLWIKNTVDVCNVHVHLNTNFKYTYKKTTVQSQIISRFTYSLKP